jgi:hypothetical protein
VVAKEWSHPEVADFLTAAAKPAAPTRSSSKTAPKKPAPKPAP